MFFFVSLIFCLVFNNKGGPITILNSILGSLLDFSWYYEPRSPFSLSSYLADILVAKYRKKSEINNFKEKHIKLNIDKRKLLWTIIGRNCKKNKIGLGRPPPFYVMYSLSKHILHKVSAISFIKTFRRKTTCCIIQLRKWMCKTNPNSLLAEGYILCLYKMRNCGGLYIVISLYPPVTNRFICKFVHANYIASTYSYFSMMFILCLFYHIFLWSFSMNPSNHLHKFLK